ncbi:hypothetical protein H072_10102 [Dactylellina haptotyla CBS 200.50]|uniref:Uncharacterized protein n=1 Tax=Dactylellina haptotyla (strain CBS 200.50) TaxID=1284197 RepID=S8A5M5_DACHA|nr:hypothetical protein H072_10102 [Dactylellina haptotyla CBS 200.50]
MWSSHILELGILMAVVPFAIATDANLNANVDEADVSTGLPWDNQRYAYKAAFDNRNAELQKPDNVVPMTQYVDNGGTVDARVSHTHPKPVPRADSLHDLGHEGVKAALSSSIHSYHTPGPVIHNPGDLEDILFTDRRVAFDDPVIATTAKNVHLELETRTVPYTTDENGRVSYRASEFEVYHTHPENGPVPMVPDINPTVLAHINKAIRPEAHPNTIRLTTTFTTKAVSTPELHPSAIPGHTHIQARALQTSEANVPTNNFIRDHDDGERDVSEYTTNVTPLSLGVTSSIYNYYYNFTVTVTYAGNSTWAETWTPLLADVQTPTNKVVGPTVTFFDPVLNITYDIVPFEDPNLTVLPKISLWWRPVATGSPTRPKDISKASSFYAAHKTVHTLPGPMLVFDSHTNVTWNQTYEGNLIDNWRVFSPVTTGYPPAFTPTLIPHPEWPPFRAYDEEVGPFYENILPTVTALVLSETPIGGVSSLIEDAPNSEPIQAEEGFRIGVIPIGYEENSVKPPSPDGLTERNPKQIEIDQHYPVPFFPDGPENYQVFSQWVGTCRVIKHIAKKGVPHKDFIINTHTQIDVMNPTDRKQQEGMCHGVIYYMLHIEESSAAAELFGKAIAFENELRKRGYDSPIPNWASLRSLVNDTDRTAEDSYEGLGIEWYDDCTPIIHHTGRRMSPEIRSLWDGNKEWIRNGIPSNWYPPFEKCERINILLPLVDGGGSIDGFQIGDWWITPNHDLPFYRELKSMRVA